jgi:hypothetical protein
MPSLLDADAWGRRLIMSCWSEVQGSDGRAAPQKDAPVSYTYPYSIISAGSRKRALGTYQRLSKTLPGPRIFTFDTRPHSCLTFRGCPLRPSPGCDLSWIVLGKTLVVISLPPHP